MSLSPPSRSPSSINSQFRRASYLPPPATYRQDCMSAAAKRYKYLRRLFKFQQMDFESAAWQMLHLLVAPQKVYRDFQYRKQNKAQFARDDPAFLVLLSLWLCISSVGFAITLGLGILSFLKLLLYVIFVDCISVGVVIASLLWFVSNRYLLKPQARGHEMVEWGFTFDVHLNAFFPLLLILHGLQLLIYYVLLDNDWFISRLAGNSLWLIALGYYVYVTFLGYKSLPILQGTQVLLYPLTALLLVYIVTIVIGWNISRSFMDFYHYRVV
ncbi:protein unc-50 homolog [Hetaerina americana]|uniref:protein unc-50 homolog n=1 Tax=Hetaerina americana TaxID=62018 RepID=UPI003A7F1095